MKRLLTVSALFLAFSVPAAAQLKVVNVPITGQHTDSWCWAASGQMTMNYLGAHVTQCDEANKRFTRTDCCNTPTPAACAVGGWPEYSKYGFTAVHTSNAPLSWAQLQGQIGARNEPYAFSWHWSGGGGHMMVLSGYFNLNLRLPFIPPITFQLARINDPLPWDPTGGGSQRWSTYSAYVSGSGYTHWDDYYNIHQ